MKWCFSHNNKVWPSLLQLWIDSSTASTPSAPEKKETDFFAEHTQVCVFLQNDGMLLKNKNKPTTYQCIFLYVEQECFCVVVVF